MSVAACTHTQHMKQMKLDNKKIFINSIAIGELEETTRTPSYCVDEDYPAGPEIQ